MTQTTAIRPAETTLADIPASLAVEELLAHLGAAKNQLLPSDCQIISDHIKAAHALALVLFRSTQR